MSGIRVVGIGDCVLTADSDTTLVTYALGSCIAVAIHDPCRGVAGLLHFMLPEPSRDSATPVPNPFMYASTGVPLLISGAADLGAKSRNLAVTLIGGAKVLDDNDFFEIGRRNYVAARQVLWRQGLLVHGEVVGGTESRTVWLEVGSGKLRVRQGGRPAEELQASHKGVRECLSAS